MIDGAIDILTDSWPLSHAKQTHHLESLEKSRPPRIKKWTGGKKVQKTWILKPSSSSPLCPHISWKTAHSSDTHKHREKFTVREREEKKIAVFFSETTTLAPEYSRRGALVVKIDRRLCDVKDGGEESGTERWWIVGEVQLARKCV